MSYTVYNGISCTCGICGQLVTHMHIRWANQYGSGIRLFCDCGTWTDKSLTAKESKLRIVKYPEKSK